MKKEQEIIQKIKVLKEQGKSYQQIATFLNSEGIDTKKRKGTWYPKVVRQIYLNHSLNSRLPKISRDGEL